MELDSLPTEVILTHPRRSLGEVQLDWIPQPGNYLALKGKTYAVLERHHHYQYKIGGYCLNKISLYVQTASAPTETSFIDGRTVIGDASCRFNARSELIRCAIDPDGPCDGCRSYESG
jgi:hypothetical protein